MCHCLLNFTIYLLYSNLIIINQNKILVCLVCKTVSTGQNSTRQNITTHGRTTQDKFFMAMSNFLFYTIFGGQNAILVF